MISFLMFLDTQWDVFFQIKFHLRMKFYSFHPEMKPTCKKKFFHSRMRFHLGYMKTDSKTGQKRLMTHEVFKSDKSKISLMYRCSHIYSTSLYLSRY